MGNLKSMCAVCSTDSLARFCCGANRQGLHGLVGDEFSPTGFISTTSGSEVCVPVRIEWIFTADDSNQGLNGRISFELPWDS